MGYLLARAVAQRVETKRLDPTDGQNCIDWRGEVSFTAGEIQAHDPSKGWTGWQKDKTFWIIEFWQQNGRWRTSERSNLAGLSAVRFHKPDSTTELPKSK
jgi:hypothetical protein